MVEERGFGVAIEDAVEVVTATPVERVLGRLARAAERVLAVAELHFGVELRLALGTSGDVVEDCGFFVGSERAIEVLAHPAMRDHGAAFPLGDAEVSRRRNRLRARNSRLPTVAGRIF